MHWLIRDLRFAIRENIRRPGFTLLAILTLALGIGAVTTMYSVIQNVLLNPFPYTDPRRMVDVLIQDTARTRGGIRGALTTPEFRAYVDESNIFEEAVGTDTKQMVFRAPYGSEPFWVAAVTPNTFHFLGVPPLLGRTVTEEDVQPGAPSIVILDYKAWMTYFHGDPNILGRKIVLDDKPMTISGVMPPHFTWNAVNAWIPDPASRNDPDAMKKGFWLQARLKRGISLERAAAELNVIARRLAPLYPDRYPKNFTIKVLTVIDWVVGRFRWVLYTLFGAVGLLLLIACCNVANMLLARATAREREIAIRGALGATRFEILRQLLLESLVLALGGGLIGIAFACGATMAVAHFIPPYTIAGETEIKVNVPVMLFSVAIAVLTALLFGIAPALHTARKDLAPGLSSAGKGAGGGLSREGLRSLLVVSEVALSLVLLTGAGALMRSFVAMTHIDLGFNPHNLVTIDLSLPNASPAQTRQFFEEVLHRISGLPGVIGAAITTGFPPYGGMTTDVEVPGKAHVEHWTAMLERCSDTYFRTLGSRFLRGVPLSRRDVVQARNVAVVNQAFVRKYFANEDPIGKRMRLDRLAVSPEAMPDSSFEITGVVADIKNQGVEEASLPEVFIPFTIGSAGFPGLLVRTAIDPGTMSVVIRREIRATNKDVLQRDARTEDEILRDFSFARPRFSMLLLNAFALIGLVLVGSGVYGVMAYSVSRRTREIGIRIALGAGRRHVFHAVLRTAVGLIGVGVFAGTLASFVTNRVISNEVWTVAAFDPITFAGGIAVVVALGLIACSVPALRAIRINPMAALRSE